MTKTVRATLLLAHKMKGYVLLQDDEGRVFCLTPKQFADVRLLVIPTCLSLPLVLFDPEILIENSSI